MKSPLGCLSLWCLFVLSFSWLRRATFCTPTEASRLVASLEANPPEIFFPTHHPSKIRYPNKRAQNFSEMYEERGSRERGCAGVGATVVGDI